MNGHRVGRAANWALAIVVLTVIVAWTFGRGVHDERDILAGWFYPTMSAAGSVILGLIVSVIAAVGAWLLGRRSTEPARRGLSDFARQRFGSPSEGRIEKRPAMRNHSA